MKKINYNEAFELTKFKGFLFDKYLLHSLNCRVLKKVSIQSTKKSGNKKDDYCVNKFIFNC